MGNYHVRFLGGKRGASPLPYPVPIIKHQRHMNSSTLSIVLLTALILSGCLHIEAPLSGTITDAETIRPVQGVVVHIDLESGLWAGPDGKRLWKDSYETISDEGGKFSLPLKLLTKLPFPFEITNGNELSIVKAGYFPSRILEPTSRNPILLYPIKYYLDYSHYKENAKKGELDLPYMDEKPEAFAKYKEELTKMGLLQFEKGGEKGVFIAVPDSQFTKLYCRTKFEFSDTRSKPYTFGVSDNVCFVFVEASL